jgi:hypothetical protein
MQSKDPAVVTKATQKADLFLQNKGKSTFNADGLRVVTNKTVINKKALEINPMKNDATSPGKTDRILTVFMILKWNNSKLITACLVCVSCRLVKGNVN